MPDTEETEPVAKKKPRGTPFEEGNSGGPGRPAGVPNKATQEVKALCQRLVEDPVYQAGFVVRLNDGKLAPQLEALVWHYAYGKPKESVDVKVSTANLDNLPEEEQIKVAGALKLLHLATLEASNHGGVH